MKQRIAFIGGGNMARAMIGGLRQAGADPARITVGEPQAAARAALSGEFGVQVHADNTTAVRGADAVIVAVKPQDAAQVLQPLRADLQSARPLLLSICAGVRIESLARWTGLAAVVRAMPNRPALVGAGVTGACAGAGVDAGRRALAEHILRSCGQVVWVGAEAQLDAVTALSGSGPAYFFFLAEQLAAAGVRLGLDPAAARTLAAETLYGAGQMAHVDADLEAQRQAVTSKGGTTEAALAVLMAGPVGQSIEAAVVAAAHRSAEMAQTYT